MAFGVSQVAEALQQSPSSLNIQADKTDKSPLAQRLEDVRQPREALAQGDSEKDPLEARLAAAQDEGLGTKFTGVI